jgi:hypothetical protein
MDGSAPNQACYAWSFPQTKNSRSSARQIFLPHETRILRAHLIPEALRLAPFLLSIR